jgi:dTMP kinase
MKTGKLITIEGIDGSGKSTLARNLAARLEERSFKVRLTKEPSSTNLGQKLRAILQNQQPPLCSKAEYLLFAADRAQHFYEIVLPSLAQGDIVISDRMADSSLAYQGYGRGLDKDMITTINSWTMESRAPDYVLYLKISTQNAFNRIHIRGESLSTFEKEKADFQTRLREGFDEIFSKRNNVIVLDATQTQEELCNEALAALLGKL